jgi:hypothetical protein
LEPGSDQREDVFSDQDARAKCVAVQPSKARLQAIPRRRDVREFTRLDLEARVARLEHHGVALRVQLIRALNSKLVRLPSAQVRKRQIQRMMTGLGGDISKSDI